MINPRPLRPEHILRAQEFAVCAIDNVVVLAWTGLPSLQGVRAVEQVFVKLREAKPEAKLGFFTLIDNEAQRGTLPERVRLALGRVLKENQLHIGSAVIAYEGQGFRATIVRSVITAIHMATRVSYSASVHSHRHAAATRLVQELGSSTRVRESAIVSVLHDLCARAAA